VQHDLNRGATGATGQDEVQPFTRGRTCQTIDLSVEEPVEVAVETEIVAPDEVELAIVGVDHLVEDHVRHARSVARVSACSCGFAADHADVERQPLIRTGCGI